MSSQVINTYSLADLDQVVPMDREQFYESQFELFQKSMKPSYAAEVVDLLLFDLDGRMIVQQRSMQKVENPGLYDTAIGTYVHMRKSPGFGLMTATLRELNAPAFLCSKQDDFSEVLHVVLNNLRTTALVQFLGKRTHTFKKLYKGHVVPMVNTYNVYLGVFGGSIDVNPSEACGLSCMSLKEIDVHISEHEDMWTSDFIFYYREYRKDIEKFVSTLLSTKN
jgi:hypothetical protein